MPPILQRMPCWGGAAQHLHSLPALWNVGHSLHVLPKLHHSGKAPVKTPPGCQKPVGHECRVLAAISFRSLGGSLWQPWPWAQQLQATAPRLSSLLTSWEPWLLRTHSAETQPWEVITKLEVHSQLGQDCKDLKSLLLKSRRLYHAMRVTRTKFGANCSIQRVFDCHARDPY